MPLRWRAEQRAFWGLGCLFCAPSMEIAGYVMRCGQRAVRCWGHVFRLALLVSLRPGQPGHPLRLGKQRTDAA